MHCAGSGLLHLLPDSVKMYNQVILSMDTPPSKWMTEFPVIYFLCALGCMVVWSVDLLNMGDSAKMMAVASAARPNCTLLAWQSDDGCVVDPVGLCIRVVILMWMMVRFASCR